MNAPAALDFCMALGAAQARLQRKLDDSLGTWHGLSLQDFVLLRVLASARGAGLTAVQLEPMLGVQASAVLRQVLALEKTGWVAREIEASGRRVITLRAPGRGVVKEAAETAGSIFASALKGSEGEGLVAAGALFQALASSAALELR
jgi:DNA-binding MarR family transcriptional regulator